MSDEPKRFDSVIEMMTHDCHKYALENTRLKAEVARLTSNTDKLCKHGDLEIERLKAEVERLRQDLVAVKYYGELLEFLKANAAKEGKQP